MDEKSRWSPTWRTMDKVLWSPGIFVRPDADFGETITFLMFFQQDKFQDKFQGKSHDRQTPPSSSLKLVDFETYYIKPNPPLLFHEQNMQLVPQHGPFSVHTMLEGLWLPKTAFSTPMVRLLDESQGPHHYKVTALGLCEVALNPFANQFRHSWVQVDQGNWLPCNAWGCKSNVKLYHNNNNNNNIFLLLDAI